MWGRIQKSTKGRSASWSTLALPAKSIQPLIRARYLCQSDLYRGYGLDPWTLLTAQTDTETGVSRHYILFLK
jgi:hypothetical protein